MEGKKSKDINKQTNKQWPVNVCAEPNRVGELGVCPGGGTVHTC